LRKSYRTKCQGAAEILENFLKFSDEVDKPSKKSINGMEIAKHAKKILLSLQQMKAVRLPVSTNSQF
jgi:hypothetical protein